MRSHKFPWIQSCAGIDDKNGCKSWVWNWWVGRILTMIFGVFSPRFFVNITTLMKGWSEGAKPSGRFIKQEQRERWRAKRKVMYGSKNRSACTPANGLWPYWEWVREEVAIKFRECICKILQYSADLVGKWFAMPSICAKYLGISEKKYGQCSAFKIWSVLIRWYWCDKTCGILEFFRCSCDVILCFYAFL